MGKKEKFEYTQADKSRIRSSFNFPPWIWKRAKRPELLKRELKFLRVRAVQRKFDQKWKIFNNVQRGNYATKPSRIWLKKAFFCIICWSYFFFRKLFLIVDLLRMISLSSFTILMDSFTINFFYAILLIRLSLRRSLFRSNNKLFLIRKTLLCLLFLLHVCTTIAMSNINTKKN